MKLFGYFRSSATYRVRIALNLKGLDYEPVQVHLVKGEQRAAEFLARNPQGLVPVLEDEAGVLSQSLAICEYLEETHPEPPLLPADAMGRARVRSIALAIACDIHPLNNLRVLRYLVRTLGVTEEAKNAWYRDWVEEGFRALEQRLAEEPETGRFCHGDTPTLADVCLVPQVFNTRRFEVDLGPYPTIRRIHDNCGAIDAFRRAHPSSQPDAQ